MSRSAYVAHVEKDKCVACGRCVEYCPAGAVRLGQKLCKKDGSEIKYPKQELPDATKLGTRKSTILIIVIIIELILMKQEQLLVKVLVLLILQYKVILKWHLKEDIKML